MTQRQTETQALIALLRADGWHMTALAKSIGVSYQTVYRWAKGQRSANPKAVNETLRRLLQ